MLASTTQEVPMPSRLNPYLSFDGDARAAMEFYADIFGGTLTMNTYGEYGDPDAPEADRIMHALLETRSGYTLMGADSPPGTPLNRGDDVALSLSGDDGDELRGYWERLSDGGTVSVPLEKQMWGDEFGMCADRFGVRWMVNIGQPAT
jgi:PhnB protein